MKNTLVVNIFGGPGTGKSTAAAYIFARLKMKGIDCEYVTEYAKDKVWENNSEAFRNQIYIGGKQSFKISRCAGKVDVIVTDSPILLSAAYETKNPHYRDTMIYEFNKYVNFNILMKRVVNYDHNGRNQNEKEALEIDRRIEELIETNSEEGVVKCTPFEEDLNRMVDYILYIIKDNGGTVSKTKD